MEVNINIPKSGRAIDEVLKELNSFKAEDANYKEGKTWSLVYYMGEEHNKLLKEAYSSFMHENGLNPMAFKSLRKMEHEVIRMAAALFHGNEETVGVMTTGGTESVMLMVKTLRDRARKEKPWIRNPEIIAPESVHVALHKGCEYFDVKLKLVKLDKNYQVDMKAVKKAINRNTIGVVGSAPQYPHGVMDPIVELSDLCYEKKIPLHVDACLGGFLLPWFKKLGAPIPDFDFSLKGVTSISADLHKYGYTAKGASVLLYRSMEVMKYQFFIFEDWPGGVFASPSMPGTKSGGSIAAAWATIQVMGEDGYLKHAKVIMETVKELHDGINAIAGLKILGKPLMSVFAYVSTDHKLNIYAVGDLMQKRGWHIDRGQFPETIHAMVTPNHAQSVELYLKDLRESVEMIKADPSLNNSAQAATYGMMANIPVRSMIKKQVWKMMQQLYSSSGTTIDLDKTIDKPENMDEFMQKLGGQIVTVKKEIERVKENFVSRFK
ncbi:MAG: pyridoxal phosphate-dependent decarboxylase family protein [Bacteriovoracaceae bacterium]